MSAWSLALAFMIVSVNCAVVITRFRPSARTIFRFVAALAAFMALLLGYTFLLGDPLRISSVVPMGVLFFPALNLLQKGSFFQKTFFTFSVLTMTSLTTIWARFIAKAFARQGAAENEPAAVIIASALAVIYLLAMLKYGSKLFMRLFANESSLVWGMYSLFPIAALFANNILFQPFMFTASEPMPSDAGHVLLTLFIFAGFVILCTAILTTQAKADADARLKFSRDLINAGRGHYQQINALHGQIYILRHDMKYSLMVFGRLLAQDNRAELERYLGEVTERLAKTQPREYCDNDVVNVLLASCAERCEEHNITFNAAVHLPGELPVPNYELCIVLGNLLENAVEACQKLEGDRRIELIIKPLGEQLVIKAANTYIGEARSENTAAGALPASTKKDGGLGLRSVKAVAEKYKGELMIDRKGGVFTAYVTLEA